MDVQKDVHALLRGKSRCLAQLVDISRSFLESAESAHGPLPGLIADFDRKREDAFRAVELIDRRINELSPHLSHSPEWNSSVREIVLQHQGLARSLQELDGRIILLIESARHGLAREIQEHGRLRDKLSKFKSQWMPDQGEGLDQKL
jgi:hypothetical protein